MEEREDLEAFTNVLRNRFYNSGYREGLFKGKSEVIQEGFDRGYKIGALFSVLNVLKGAFDDSNVKEELEEDFVKEEDEILKEIEEIKETLLERIPEIKIASNLIGSALS